MILAARHVIQRPVSLLMRSDSLIRQRLRVAVPVTQCHVGFQTSSRRAIPPVVWVLVKPIAKVAAALTGRGVRKWWRALPKEHKTSVLMRMSKHWYMFVMAGAGVGAWSVYFYKSHIVPAPVTGRERFIVITADQLKKISDAESQVFGDARRKQVCSTTNTLSCHHLSYYCTSQTLHWRRGWDEVELKNWKQELFKFLRHYRATPHSSTKVSPFEALYGRKMRIQLPEITLPKPVNKRQNIESHDAQSKQRMKVYADENRHAMPSSLGEGQTVLVKQPLINKATSPYNPKPYVIVQKKGSMITAQREDHEVTRNASHFKEIPAKFASLTQGDRQPEPMESSELQQDIMPNTYQTNLKSCLKTPVSISDRPSRERKPPVRFKDYVCFVCF